MTSLLYAHQKEGIRRIVEQPYLWLGDEMGAGKTRQAIEAAQVLHDRGVIDQTVVVAPAQVFRDVWFDPELGQLAEYVKVPSIVREYRARGRSWDRDFRSADTPLIWTVANYEYLRRPEHLQPLVQAANDKTFLILDESLAVKSRSSETTMCIWLLRQACGRVLLLNGTEGGGDTPADLYAQAKMMSPNILGCRHWYEFQARYAKLGGYQRPRKERQADGSYKVVRTPTQIVDWVNVDDLWRRLAPYYLRRTKAECLDLPPKIPAVAIDVALTPATWKLYRQMRDQAVAELEGGVVTAEQAGVKALRLAQLTSGFIGGVRALNDEGVAYGDPEIREVGREKLDAALAWVEEQGRDPRFVIWCRFRAEAERLHAALSSRFPGRGALLVGGQDQRTRRAAVALLNPRTAPTSGPIAGVGTVRTGALGLDLQAADRELFSSNDHSHIARTQAEDRIHRPGQDRPCHYFDLVATGPDGQRTVDHAIVRTLRKKKSIAEWGVAEWLAAIREE